MEEPTKDDGDSENHEIDEMMELQEDIDNLVSNSKKMRSAKYISGKEKAELLYLGGKTTASFMKSARAGERPRMIGDAISGDLTDGINEFVSKRCMKFSSFRDVWQSRKLSLLHHAVPKKCSARFFIQQAFLVALDLLMKDELLPSSGAKKAVPKSRSASYNGGPARLESVRPTLHGYRIGPGSLPFQIGALYSLYCLHGTQLFCSRVPIRVSPQGMLALIHLHRRLKSAGPLASDARAVLARLVLDEDNSTLQLAACPGPTTIAFVDSTIPLTKATTKPETRAKEMREIAREKALAAEAKEAANRALSEEARSTDAPRPRIGYAVRSLLDRVKKLSPGYEEYGVMLKRSRAGGCGDRASSDGGNKIAGESGKSPAHRSQRFRRDLERILECGIDEATAVKTHGLALLARSPPLAAVVPTSPNANSLFSLRLPKLPELPPRVDVSPRVGGKRPDGIGARAVGYLGRVRQAIAESGELIQGESRRGGSGGNGSENNGNTSGSGGNVSGSGSGGNGMGSGTNGNSNGSDNRSGGSSGGGGRDVSGGTGLRTIRRIGVRDHLRLVAKSLQEAEERGNDGESATVSRRGTSGIDGAGVQRDGRGITWRNSSVVNGSAAMGIVRPPGGFGNASRSQCEEGGDAVKLPGGLGNSSRGRGAGGDAIRQNSSDNRVGGGKGKKKQVNHTENRGDRDGNTKADEAPKVGTSPSEIGSSSEDEGGGATKTWDGLKDMEAFAASMTTCTGTSGASIAPSSRAASRRPDGAPSRKKWGNDDGGNVNSDAEEDSMLDSSLPPQVRKGGRNTSAARSSDAAFGEEPLGQKPLSDTASRARGCGKGRKRGHGRGRGRGRGQSAREQPDPAAIEPTDNLSPRDAKKARLSSTLETPSLLTSGAKRGVTGRKRKLSSAADAAADVEERESEDQDGDDDGGGGGDDPRVASLFNFAAELESSSLVPTGGNGNNKKKQRLNYPSSSSHTKAANKTKKNSKKTPAKSPWTARRDPSGSCYASKQQSTTDLGPSSATFVTAVESPKSSEDSRPKPSTAAAAATATASPSSGKSSVTLMGREGPRTVKRGTNKGVNGIGGDTSSDSGSDDDGLGHSVSSRGKGVVGGGPSNAGSSKSIGVSSGGGSGDRCDDAGERKAKENAVGEEEAQQAKKKKIAGSISNSNNIRAIYRSNAGEGSRDATAPPKSVQAEVAEVKAAATTTRSSVAGTELGETSSDSDEEDNED